MTESTKDLIIGVRPDDGLALIYAVTQDASLQTGDRVSVQINAEIISGVVVISPDQMLEYHGHPPVARATRSNEVSIARPELVQGPALLSSLGLSPDAIDPRRL